MKLLEVYGFDVFADRPGRGNPASVVPEAAGLSAGRMQAIARRLGRETTFVLAGRGKPGIWRLRFFTPAGEIELCGHGTIAALAALAAGGALPPGSEKATLESRAGRLEAELAWEGRRLRNVVMGQLSPVFASATCSSEELAVALGAPARALAGQGLPPACASTGRAKLLACVPDWQTLDGLSPDWQALDALCRKAGVTGVYAYTLKPRNPLAAAEARQFPAGGGRAAEDPVTGVAACALGAYLVERKIIVGEGALRTMIVEQGYATGRPGAVEVRLRVEGEKIVAAQIAGGAILVSRAILGL